MSNLLIFLLNLTAILLFLFFYFKSVKKQLDPSIIFSFGFLNVLFSIIFSFIFYLFSKSIQKTQVFDPHGLWYWGLMLGFMFGIYYATKRYKLNINKTLDDSLVGFLVAISIASQEIVPSLVTLVVFLLVKKLNNPRLKGFGSLSKLSLGVYFLVRASLALFASGVIAFTSVGKADAVISAAISFLFFFSVYNINTNVRRK